MGEIIDYMFSKRFGPMFALGLGVTSSFMYLTKPVRENVGWAFWQWSVSEFNWIDGLTNLAAFLVAAFAVSAAILEFERRKKGEASK